SLVLIATTRRPARPPPFPYTALFRPLLGVLLSLGTQAALTAADTPDTRSWATLPARIAIGRVTVPPGEHEVVLQAQNVRRKTKRSEEHTSELQSREKIGCRLLLEIKK